MGKFFRCYKQAKTLVETSNINISDHFIDINKTINMPKGAEKNILVLCLQDMLVILLYKMEIQEKNDSSWTTIFCYSDKKARD